MGLDKNSCSRRQELKLNALGFASRLKARMVFGTFIVCLSLTFFQPRLSAITVSPIQTDKDTFFEIPAGETIATYRSFHAETNEKGNNKSNNVEVGNGDFITISSYNVDPNWIVNTEYDFTLSYDAAGNLSFIVDGIGMTAPLVYQPTNAIKQVFIGNDNNSSISFQGMELTNMVFDSATEEAVVLPDLLTEGEGNTFEGLIISSFGDTWDLTGTFSFTTPEEGGSLGHNSSFKFYGAAETPVVEESDVEMLEVTRFGFPELEYQSWNLEIQGSQSKEIELTRYGYNGRYEPKADFDWTGNNGKRFPFVLSYDAGGTLQFEMSGADPYFVSVNPVESFDELHITLHNTYVTFSPGSFVEMVDVLIDGNSLGNLDASTIYCNEEGDVCTATRLYRIKNFGDTFVMTGSISMHGGDVLTQPVGTYSHFIGINGVQVSEEAKTPSIFISSNENGAQIDYTGVLQTSDTLDGTWEDVLPQPATSSTVPTDQGSKFYRARE